MVYVVKRAFPNIFFLIGSIAQLFVYLLYRSLLGVSEMVKIEDKKEEKKKAKNKVIFC